VARRQTIDQGGGGGHDDAPVEQRIVTEATRLFAEKGYAGTSTAEIVQAAGVTKPMVYYYFGDKEGLFRAVLEQLNGRLREGLTAVEQRRSAADEALADVAELLFAITRESPTASRLQFASYYGPGEGEVGAALKEGPTLTHNVLRRIARRGVQAGALRGDAGDIAFAVQGTVNIRIMAHLHDPEVVQVPVGLGHHVVDDLLAGFRSGHKR